MIQDAYSCDLNLSISESCRSLEVSRSGYSYWLNGTESVPCKNTDQRNQIQEIALEFPGLWLSQDDGKFETFEDAFRNIRHFIETTVQ